MGVLPDWMIEESGAIAPFASGLKRPNTISYGVTSYGYDLRVGYRFKVFTNVHGAIIDPKKWDPRGMVEVNAPRVQQPCEGQGPCRHCGRSVIDNASYRCDKRGYAESKIVIPPNSFALAETLETITVPRDMLCIVIGKSTYARCGLIVNVTPLEPEWHGKITMELSNTAPMPSTVYAGEGIAQVLFVKAEAVCRTSYADKQGKYQNQLGLTDPKVD